MKARFAFSLFLCSLLFVMLSVSALAQSNSSSNAAPTAPAPTSSVALEPLPPPAHNSYWDGDDPNLVNLVTHPFANKKYVQRLTRPIKDRLDELDQLTAGNAAAIKDVDARAQHGLQLASEKESLADQHATDATNRALLSHKDADPVHPLLPLRKRPRRAPEKEDELTPFHRVCLRAV